MNKLEEITNPCTWKVISNNKDSSTFKQVSEGHKLYNCIECSGTRGSCPNYVDHNALVEGYGGLR